MLEAPETIFGDLLKDVSFDKSYELTGDKQTACPFVAIFNSSRRGPQSGTGAGVLHDWNQQFESKTH